MLIDPHAHLLPALGSLALSFEEALALANTASRQGVTHVVSAVPYHGEQAVNRSQAELRVKQFQEELARRGLTLEIFPAHEVWVDQQASQVFTPDNFLFTDLNQTYALVNVSQAKSANDLGAFFFTCFKRDIRPILIQAEDQKELQADPTPLMEWLDAGAYVLLGAERVLAWKSEAGQLAHNLLCQGQVHLLGSAGTSSLDQAPTYHLQEAYHLVEERYGDSYAFDLRQNAKALVNGEPFVTHFTIKKSSFWSQFLKHI